MEFKFNGLFKDEENISNAFEILNLKNLIYYNNNTIIENKSNNLTDIIRSKHSLSKNQFFPCCIYLYLSGKVYLGLSDKNFNKNKWIGKNKRSTWSISLDVEGKVWYKGNSKYDLKPLEKGDLIIFGIDIKTSNLLIIQINYFKIIRKFNQINDIDLCREVSSYLTNLDGNNFISLNNVNKEYFVVPINFHEISEEIYPTINLEENGKVCLWNFNQNKWETIVRIRFILSIIHQKEEEEEVKDIFKNPLQNMSKDKLINNDLNQKNFKLIKNHLEKLGFYNTLSKIENIKSKKITKSKKEKNFLFIIRKYLFNNNYSTVLKIYKKQLKEANITHYFHLLKFLQIYKKKKFSECVTYFKNNLNDYKNDMVEIITTENLKIKIEKLEIENFSNILVLNEEQFNKSIYNKFENNFLFEHLINILNDEGSNWTNMLKITKVYDNLLKEKRNGFFDILNI